jgi:hypothetical protein
LPIVKSRWLRIRSRWWLRRGRRSWLLISSGWVIAIAFNRVGEEVTFGEEVHEEMRSELKG